MNSSIVSIGLTVYHNAQDRGAGIVTAIVRGRFGPRRPESVRITVKWADGTEDSYPAHQLKKTATRSDARNLAFNKFRTKKVDK